MDNAEAHFNLGIALAKQGKLRDAAVSFRQAVRLKPDYASAWLSLGNVLTRLGEPEEAVASLQQACKLRPKVAEVHSSLGGALERLGRAREALACYQEALRLDPNHVWAHMGQAHHWLLTGDFQRGWPEYEWRWKRPEIAPWPFPQPRWDGSPGPKQTILVFAEQGLGDTLQFIRYVPLVKEHVGTVMVRCQETLRRLLARCPGIDRLIAGQDPLPDFDIHAPLMTLPGLLGTTRATIPAQVPYLFADPQLIEHWQRRLADTGQGASFRGAKGDFKVGIGWQGNPANPSEIYRTVPLACFATLAHIPGVRLISLQKGGHDQLAQVSFPVTDLGSEVDEAAGTFMDTAAIMKSLDLVVTSDTALPHLAGGLGVPVWMATPLAPDWRWLLDGDECPWYPTMRLSRQARLKDWEAVFARMANELESLLGRKALAGTAGEHSRADASG